LGAAVPFSYGPNQEELGKLSISFVGSAKALSGGVGAGGAGACGDGGFVVVDGKLALTVEVAALAGGQE
jgi:hypothetical protein